MKTIVLVALLAAAGCSKKPDCGTAITRGLDGFAATVTSRTPDLELKERMTVALGKLKTALTERCVDDGWSAEVLKCFETIHNMRDIQACESKLTTDQHTKASAAQREVMMGGQRMPAGQPGHPQILHGTDGSAAGSAAAAGSPPATGSAAPAAGSAAPAAASAAGSSAPAAGGW